MPPPPPPLRGVPCLAAPPAAEAGGVAPPLWEPGDLFRILQCTTCHWQYHYYSIVEYFFFQQIKVFAFTCPLRLLPLPLLPRLPLLPSCCSKAPSPSSGPGGSRRWNLKKKTIAHIYSLKNQLILTWYEVLPDFRQGVGDPAEEKLIIGKIWETFLHLMANPTFFFKKTKISYLACASEGGAKAVIST